MWFTDFLINHGELIPILFDKIMLILYDKDSCITIR